MTSKITVYVRLREKETLNTPWTVQDNTLYQILDSTTKLSYICYESVFKNEKTLDIYKSAIRPIIEEALEGTNATIFAYGQTGSGKTYTMLGDELEPGIIRLALTDILKKSTVRVSYLEIYNENVFDLININRNVKVYGSNANLCLTNVTREEIRSMKEAMEVIRKCETKRRTGKTEFNERSSRSHTVFQVFMQNGKTLSLIDLAGSEKATGCSERRKEGAYINKSLLALGSVINKLISNEYVNFRDSKLTRILQQSLDGNSNVVSLCMISPNKECVSESINTLKFAARLSKVELKERHSINLVETSGNNLCPKCKDKDEPQKIDFVEMNSVNKDVYDDLKNTAILLKAENELYVERIKALEETVKSLLSTTSSRRINDLFVLERNMFQLQLEIIKRKKKQSK